MAKYKKRKDGRYSTSVTVGRDEEGKPVKKVVYGKTVKEVDDKRIEIISQLNGGTFVLDDSVTVGEWSVEWLDVYKSGKEYKTYQGYASNIKNHIRPSIGMYKLKDVRTHHIQKMINSLVAQKKIETSRKVLNTLRQIFEKAIDENLIVKNPCKGIELPKPQKPQKRSLTNAEKEIIFNTEFSEKQRAFVFTLLFSGLRREEILTLMRNDIDLKKGTINVNKALTFVGNRPETKLPKSQAGNRIIPIPSVLKNVLIPYLESLDGLIVFPSAHGALMSKVAYKRFWDTITRRLNIAAGGNSKIQVIANDITAHLFRHTYATMLYEAGVDAKTAQYLLGHADIKTTMNIYTHLDDDKKYEAAKKIDELLSSHKVVSSDKLIKTIQ